MRLFHPHLGREIIIPDSSKLACVLEQAGWESAPEPATAEPGREPEPVRYEPVTKPKAKTAKSEPKATDKP